MANSFAYPSDGSLRDFRATGDRLDGQFTALPHPAPDAIALTVATFLNMPGWANALLDMRDVVLRPFGFKTGGPRQRRIPSYDEVARRSYSGAYRVYSANEDEVVLGADERHLSFRVSILRSVPDDLVAITTLFIPHTRWGRLLLAAIYPFNRLIVGRCLANTASLGIVAA